MTEKGLPTPGLPTVAPTADLPAEHVPLRSKIAWAVGSLGDNYASQMLSQLATPVYNIALGLPFDKLQSALFLPRWLDAFADPTVGYLSDNFRSRWGRRRPFILCGAMVLAMMAYALWLPGLAWSHAALAWFISGATLLYYLAYALFIVPYRALGFELTRDYHERTRIQGWGMIFALIGGQGLPWLPELALFFGGADSNAASYTPEVMLRGVRWVGLGVGFVILLACAAPALFCQERAESAAQEKLSLRAALRETLKNWPFFNMLLSRTAVLLATFAVIAMAQPLAIHYLYAGNASRAFTMLGFAGNVLFAGACIGIPFNSWVSTKFGKRHAYFSCLAIASAGVLSQFITYRPAHPYWTLASQFVFGFGVQGVWLMCQSIVADVCDEDEIRTGCRREGIYGAAYALLEKLGVAGGGMLGGMIAAFAGYSAGAPSPEALHGMWLASILLPVAGMALAGTIIFFYPLTHGRMVEIRRELDARRTKKS